jgi:hypothetical protein
MQLIDWINEVLQDSAYEGATVKKIDIYWRCLFTLYFTIDFEF